MNIWEFNAAVTRRLRMWAGFSISSGFSLQAQKDPFWQGVGTQFAGWGLINLLIALVGGRTSSRRAALPNANEPEIVAKESRNLHRLLWINTGLDVFYMLGGIWLAGSKGASDEKWRGQGWGIVVQGGFLFVFDLVHALLMRRPDNVRPQ